MLAPRWRSPALSPAAALGSAAAGFPLTTRDGHPAALRPLEIVVVLRAEVRHHRPGDRRGAAPERLARDITSVCENPVGRPVVPSEAEVCLKNCSVPFGAYPTSRYG
jgi:hypothetical protein